MTEPDAGYRRVLSRLDATMIVIGSIIGGGIFFTPQAVARTVGGSETLVLAAWGLGGLIALTGALTYAELGGLFPRTGGVYVFLREAFGGLPAFLYSWAVLLVIAPGALAVVAGFFAELLCEAVGLGARAHTAVALLTIVSLVAVNIRGVRWGSTVQNASTAAKLLALVVLIGAGLAFTGEPAAPVPALLGAATPDVPASGPPAALLLAAMLPVLFSYGGWQNGTYVAGEMRDPERDVPAAIVIGTLVVVAVYVLVNVAAMRVLGPEGLAATRTFAAEAAERALGPPGRALVTAGILVSTFGICAAIPLTNPRVVQATAADGFFFAPFARLHARYRTPAWAIALLGVWACTLLLLGTAEQLLAAVVFADWVFFALCGIALFVFRRRRPDAHRPYRCAFYPWVPLLFTALAIVVAAGAWIHADAHARRLGPGVLAAGALVYVLQTRRLRRAPGA